MGWALPSPAHPAHTPPSEEESKTIVDVLHQDTLNEQWYPYTSVYWGWWGSRRQGESALPSLHGARTKPPGRLPRSVKVKDLTPQKKVKEWVKNVPPTRAATSDTILMKKVHFSWGGRAAKRQY